ncbi:Protein of unknown function, partial [Gryllus bimaculatus]
SPSSATGGGG